MKRFQIGSGAQEFIEGVHYRKTTPAESGGGRYRFILMENVRLYVNGLTQDRERIIFYDGDGNEWMRWDRLGVMMASGYAWNGCSPKRKWLGVWWGTPDFESTRAAALFHDGFYQFHATKHFWLSRQECDEIFRDLVMDCGDDDLARIYYFAVREFGAWSGRCDHGEHSTRERI